jgi:hypothetical protein
LFLRVPGNCKGRRCNTSKEGKGGTQAIAHSDNHSNPRQAQREVKMEKIKEGFTHPVEP